jgi:hypothetical protein
LLTLTAPLIVQIIVVHIHFAILSRRRSNCQRAGKTQPQEARLSCAPARS